MDEMKIPTTGFMDFRIYKHHFSFYTNEQAVQGNSGSDIAAVVLLLHPTAQLYGMCS